LIDTCQSLTFINLTSAGASLEVCGFCE